MSEKKSATVYVPRDEAFADIKQTQFLATTASSGLSAITRAINSIATNQTLAFSSIDDIDMLFKNGFTIPQLENTDSGLLQRIIPKIVQVVSNSQQVLRFDTPETFKSRCF